MIDSGKRNGWDRNRGLPGLPKTRAEGFAPRLIYP
jgi:hypothetical protein